MLEIDWFYFFSIYIFSLIILAFLAKFKNRNIINWIFISFLISPIGSILLLIIQDGYPSSKNPVIVSNETTDSDKK